MHDLNAAGYDTDKLGYVPRFDREFGPLHDQKIKLLELGVYQGASMLMWRDYFPQGTACGVDLKLPEIEDTSGRIHMYAGRQDDTALLDRIAVERAPDGFDVIIDDCAHQGRIARTSFWHLFENHLKPGGLYIIEDWGTGYWKGWPDGAVLKRGAGRSGRRRLRSHDYGMVGFIKQLVDECGAIDVTHPEHGIPPARLSAFEDMRVTPGVGSGPQGAIKNSGQGDSLALTTPGRVPAQRLRAQRLRLGDLGTPRRLRLRQPGDSDKPK